MICSNCKKKFSSKIKPSQTIKAIELYKKGLSCRKIASLTGISFASVSRIAREYQTLVNVGVIK